VGDGHGGRIKVELAEGGSTLHDPPPDLQADSHAARDRTGNEHGNLSRVKHLPTRLTALLLFDRATQQNYKQGKSSRSLNNHEPCSLGSPQRRSVPDNIWRIDSPLILQHWRTPLHRVSSQLPSLCLTLRPGMFGASSRRSR